MKRSLIALIFSLFAVVSTLGFGWIYLRSKANRQPIPPPIEHSFLQPGLELIAWRGSSQLAPENTWPALDLAAQLDPSIILWIDVQITKDGTYVLLADRELERRTDGQGLIGFTSIAEVDKLNAADHFSTSSPSDLPTFVAVPHLEATLLRYPNHRFVLNFADYRPGQERPMIEVLERTKSFSRVLIHSSAENFLKEVRNERGRWLYGTSPVRLTQLRILSTLGLEGLAKLTGDIVVDLGSSLSRAMLDPGTIHEIHRRHLRYFAGPVEDETNWNRMMERGVDGVITKQPELWLKAWREARSRSTARM